MLWKPRTLAVELGGGGGQWRKSKMMDAILSGPRGAGPGAAKWVVMSVMMSGRPPHHLSSAAHHPPARPPSLLSPIDSSSSALFVGEILSTLNNGPSCSRALSRGGSIVGHREVMSVCLRVVLTVSGARVPLQILFLDLRVHSNTVFAPRILSSEFPNLKLGQIYPESLIVDFSNYV